MLKKFVRNMAPGTLFWKHGHLYSKMVQFSEKSNPVDPIIFNCRNLDTGKFDYVFWDDEYEICDTVVEIKPPE